LNGYVPQGHDASDPEFRQQLEYSIELHTFQNNRADRFIAQTPSQTNLSRVFTLQELQSWFEQYAIAGYTPVLDAAAFKRALTNCQQHHSAPEVLSVLNSLFARYTHDHTKTAVCLHVEGMYYAAQCFSPPALYHHLRAVQYRDMSEDDGKSIIKALLYSLRTIAFADPNLDKNPMLGLVAGEGPHAMAFSCSLIDTLPLGAGSYSLFVQLLWELGARRTLVDVWSPLIERLSQKPRPSLLDDAYQCILTYLDHAETTKFAFRCLKELQQISSDLPSQPIFSRLLSVVGARWDFSSIPSAGKAIINGLDDQLRSIENRLGSAWMRALSEPPNEMHSQLAAEDVSFLSRQSDISEVGSIRHLLAEIHALGSSHSSSDLSTIVDLLDEYEGSVLPLFHQQTDIGDYDFAWLPQWSPIEFSGDLVPLVTDTSTASSPTTLGLLRARIESRGLPVNLDRARYLLQLGYLAQRPGKSRTELDSLQIEHPDQWKETGYIVAFDRIASEFVLVFMGKGTGIVEPGNQLISSQSNPQFGPISILALSADIRDFKPVEDVVFPIPNASAQYYLDLDPGLDLTP
jgi:hypothetical protein